MRRAVTPRFVPAARIALCFDFLTAKNEREMAIKEDAVGWERGARDRYICGRAPQTFGGRALPRRHGSPVLLVPRARLSRGWTGEWWVGRRLALICSQMGI